MKLTSKQVTQAVQQYAKRHGYFVQTVRVLDFLKFKAIREWKERQLRAAS